MNTVIVGLGSNIKPAENILKARRVLAKKYNILKESDFIKTKAIGKIPQADFLNGTMLLQTSLNMNEFRKSLKEIEQSLGRKARHQPFAPRTIDLDILIWNGKLIDRDVYKRDFLEKSVSELMPDFENKR